MAERTSLPIPRAGRLLEHVAGALIELQVFQASTYRVPVEPDDPRLEVLQTCADLLQGAWRGVREPGNASERDRAYGELLERTFNGELANPTAWLDLHMTFLRVLQNSEVTRSEISQCIIALTALNAQLQREVVKMRAVPISIMDGQKD